MFSLKKFKGKYNLVGNKIRTFYRKTFKRELEMFREKFFITNIFINNINNTNLHKHK